MTLEVFDNNFARQAVCDDYESAIWTDRYNEYGDFELCFGLGEKKDFLSIYLPDYYLLSEDSEYGMILTGIKIETDAEAGNRLIVTGQSFESILTRRIIWTQTTISGNFQNAIKKLINENIISPSIENRKISNFKFIESEDERITSLTIDETQFTGTVLYEAIKALCDVHNVGFKVILNRDSNDFEFSLYLGEDKSYSQETNPYVVFSPTFDNIINSSYLENQQNYSNIALVAGEGEGAARKKLVVGNETVIGVDRRELFVDARDLSSNVNGGTLSAAQYNNVLKNRGLEKLDEVDIEKVFEGQAETSQLYRYGEHFFMGDIVELENDYGITSKVRVTEYIYSDSTSEITEYPTFKIIEDEEEEGE